MSESKHNFESKKLDTKAATYCIILYKVQKLIKLSVSRSSASAFPCQGEGMTVTFSLLLWAGVHTEVYTYCSYIVFYDYM